MSITLIKGPTNSGKTKKLQSIYNNLLNSARADQILVLVRNRRQSLLWRDQITAKTLTNIKIQSVFGFFQNEIKKYWPMIDTQMSGIVNKSLEPNFITSEISQYTLTQLVEEFRSKGKLMQITATSQQIAIESLTLLSRLSDSSISIYEVDSKIINSFYQVNELKNIFFLEIKELLIKYTETCKKNGFIDSYLSVELYKTLLSNDKYKQMLISQIKHLIIDDIQDATPTEVDFINSIIIDISSAAIALSTDGTFLRRQGSCPEYFEKTLLPNCSEIIELNSLSNISLFDFSDKLYDAIINSSDSQIQLTEKFLALQSELRNDMLSMVYEIICEHMDNGYQEQDFAIICPTVDNVSEFYLKNLFSRKSINITNISRSSKYIENSLVRSLITLSCLCHPDWNINPPEHEIANLISILLEVDPVRSSLIARETMKQKPFTLPDINNSEINERIAKINLNKFEKLKSWTESYRSQLPMSIDSFLETAVTYFFLSANTIENSINMLRALIESASNFIKTYLISLSEKSIGKDFIQMVKAGTKPAETLLDLEYKLYTDDLIITTPQAYISSSMFRRIQIWIDVSSPIWHKSDVTEILNPYILSPVWNDAKWSEELDEKNRLIKYGTVLKHLIRKSPEKIILASSIYNQDGMENSGILNEIIVEAL